MSEEIRAAFHVYPKSKFPIRVLMFDHVGDLVFDTGEIKGFAAVEVPALGAGGVRYSVTIFGDGDVLFHDDPTCSGTVNYAHDDMDVLGRLMHFIQIVQVAGRWFVEESSRLGSMLPEDAVEIRAYFDKQAEMGERFLEGAEVTRKMLEDAASQEE